MTDDQQQTAKKKKSRRSGKPEGGPALGAAVQTSPADDDAAVHTVGKTLRSVRERMKLSLDDVSSAINVRVAQLQAIEDDRIDQLPGMTYAVGFVRSYAQFLKLDAKAVVATFKEEHAGEPGAKTALQFTDPISEDKLPGPVLIGAAAFCIVVLFLAWSLLSSDDEGVEVADNIPPAPVVGTASGQPTLADSQPLTGYATGMITPAEPAAKTAADPAAEQAGAEAAKTAAPEAAPAATQAPADKTAQADIAAATNEPAAEMVVKPTRAPAALRDPNAQQQPLQPQINIKQRGKGRIVLEANQKSWIQVSDGDGKVVFKKVLSAGERFFVPDQKGMTLVTSNAGGLDIIVDGAKVQSLGRSGEILRGVPLNADELKKTKIRVRD